MKTLLFALALWAGPAANAAGPSLVLHPCRLPGVPDEVRCGTLEVFENRDARSGRRIALAAAVLPALGADRLPDPVAFFDGGPGEATIEDAGYFQDHFKAPRSRPAPPRSLISRPISRRF
ncbi:MAG TPA: hypothetical protein VH988_16875 [Thermoanaerobaculia bacterium]|nr:hypothetical protein [Thermoanaerobaculia bacterium]